MPVQRAPKKQAGEEVMKAEHWLGPFSPSVRLHRQTDSRCSPAFVLPFEVAHAVQGLNCYREPTGRPSTRAARQGSPMLLRDPRSTESVESALLGGSHAGLLGWRSRSVQSGASVRSVDGYTPLDGPRGAAR